MANFKPVTRPTQIKQDGTTNIKIRVTHNRRVGYLPTEHYIFPKEMEKSGKINSLYRNYQEADEINMKLLVQIGEYAARISRSKDKIGHYTLSMLLKFLREEGDPTDLITIIDSKIKTYDTLKNINYRDTYKITKSLLSNHLGYKVLPLELITAEWLAKSELALKTKGLSPNYIGIHMRNIRTCFNEAITMGRIDLSAYPFRKYKIPKARTRKRNTTVDETAAIARKEIKEPLMAWARDMFMLSVYLIGINMRDLMFLTKVEEGRIYYTRSKGKKDYSIKVQPEAQAIISRYPGKKYLLDTMDNYNDYRTASSRINHKLKDIAELCKIDKKITTYYARHTWATVASKIGISRDTIRYALGHSLSTVTDIYIDYDLEAVDQANRSVIDHLNNIEITQEEEVPTQTHLPPVIIKPCKIKIPLSE
jgi:site-specific recombinase XerD